MLRILFEVTWCFLFLSLYLTVLERLFDSVAPSICLILDEEESLLAQKTYIEQISSNG